MAYANLGLALQMAGDDEGAAEAARRALIETPEDVTIATVAGSIFEHAGLTNEAIDAYGAAMQIDPSLAQSPYWGTSETRQSLRAQVLAASELDACELGRQAGIYGVYVDELPALTSDCREIVDAPGGKAERPDLAIMLFAQGQTEEASAEADEALKTLGRNADTLVMSSLVSSDGDLAQARSDLFDARGHADAAALLAYTYSSPARLGAADIPFPNARRRCRAYREATEVHRAGLRGFARRSDDELSTRAALLHPHRPAGSATIEDYPANGRSSCRRTCCWHLTRCIRLALDSNGHKQTPRSPLAMPAG